jgi:DNA-binding beta-propeller fold protein YncE
MIPRSLAGVAVMLALAGVAHGGGTIRGYVPLPDLGSVAFVDVNAGRVLKTVAVPRGAGPVVASIDGSRVLVANTRRGLVTETNGISGRRTRTFRGLGRPIDLALIPRTTIGLGRGR